MGKSGDSKDRSGARWDGRQRSGISKGYTSGSGEASLWVNIAEKSVIAWCCYLRLNRGVWLSTAEPRLHVCRVARHSLQIFNSAYVYLQPHLLLMPPKKKTKILSRAAPTDADSPLPEIVTFDGWTDEQETTLFKAISVYRLKPAGELHQATVPNQ